MSDPIHLFDKHGNPVTLFAPTWVKEQVKAGELFWHPPAVMEAPEQPPALTLDELSDDELRQMAKDREIPSYWLMKRETLIEKLDGL